MDIKKQKLFLFVLLHSLALYVCHIFFLAIPRSKTQQCRFPSSSPLLLKYFMGMVNRAVLFTECNFRCNFAASLLQCHNQALTRSSLVCADSINVLLPFRIHEIVNFGCPPSLAHHRLLVVSCRRLCPLLTPISTTRDNSILTIILNAPTLMLK